MVTDLLLIDHSDVDLFTQAIAQVVPNLFADHFTLTLHQTHQLLLHLPQLRSRLENHLVNFNFYHHQFL